MNKVRATYKRLDYNNGDFLAHYQWRVMQDSVMFVWKGLQDDEDGMWTTDGHYYLFTYIGMLMGMSYEEAEKYGRAAEKPDTYVLTEKDIKNEKIVLGKDEEISLEEANKGSSKVGYLLKKGKINIARPTYLINQDGHYFVLSSNVYEWPDHVINQEDFERGYIYLGKDVNGRAQVIYFIKPLKAGDMLENITWLVGGLQQQYHCLTGGYHGVELAVTAYMIDKYRKTHDKDFWGYLLHRFGDSFAHFKCPNNQTFDTSDELQDYINVVDEYLESKLAHVDFTKDKLDKPIERSYKDAGWGGVKMNVRTTLDKEDVKWRMLKSVIRASDDNELEDLDPKAYVTNSSFEFDDIRDGIREALKKKFNNKTQLENVMYNGTLPNLDIYCGRFNAGHGVVLGESILNWFKKESSEVPTSSDVDDILRRKNLFMYYVTKSVQLFKIMDKKCANVKTEDIVNKIKKIVNTAEKATTDKSMKLDAVFAFHLYLLRLEDAKKNGKTIESLVIPIKHLSDDIKETDSFVRPYYYVCSDFGTSKFKKSNDTNNEGVHKFVDFLNDYIKFDEDLAKKILGFRIIANHNEYIVTPLFK